MSERVADRMKARLADALWELLGTRRLTEVSVGDVIEAAGVSRGSFYYHFSDLDHLVAWAISQELLNSDREGTRSRRWQPARSRPPRRRWCRGASAACACFWTGAA